MNLSTSCGERFPAAYMLIYALPRGASQELETSTVAEPSMRQARPPVLQLFLRRCAPQKDHLALLHSSQNRCHMLYVS